MENRNSYRYIERKPLTDEYFYIIDPKSLDWFFGNVSTDM